jgi:hypothetical protein
MHLGGRRTAIPACVLLCLVVVFAYAGGAWASALYRLLTDGVLLLVWLACATGLGAAVLVALPLGDDAKPGRLLHLVTAAALGIGLLSLATLGLGLAGWLNRGTACALLGCGAVAGGLLLFTWRVRLARVSLPEANAGEAPASRETGGQIRVWLNAPTGWSWLWLAAMPFLGMAIVVAMMPPGLMWPDEPHWYDVVEYHLQIPREWYEIGRIVPLRHNAFSYFPFNVEMHYLLAMHLRGGPWAGMYLAQLMHLTMVALTVVATYGFARRVAPNRATATIAGVAVATVPWLTQLGSIAYNEGGFLLFGTLATGWATLAVAFPARRLGRFPVAGLMAGFSCGCKLTAVPEVLLAVGGLATLGILLHRRTRSTTPPPSGTIHSNVLKNIRIGDLHIRSTARAASADSNVLENIRTGVSPDGGTVGGASVNARAPVAWPGDAGDAAAGPGVPDAFASGTAAAATVEGIPPALRLAGVATFFVAGVLAFVPWLARNQVWAGNSVFPEAASLLGRAHFSDTQVQRWHQAHSPRPDQRALTARLRAWFADVWGSWQYGYALLPLGVLAAPAAMAISRAERHRAKPGEPGEAREGRRGGGGRGPALAAAGAAHHSNILKNIGIMAGMPLGVFVALSVIWIGFTHLQGRFFILGVPLAGLMLAAMPWGTRASRVGVAAVVLAAAVVGFARLHETLTGRPHASELMTAIGYEDLSVLAVPQPFADAIKIGGPVVLVGDARAFAYTIPMSRLHYRTVFDVDAKPGESVIDAWAAGAPADARLLVDPNELRRFNQTYYGIPELPAGFGDAREPIVLPPPPSLTKR